MKKNNWQRLLFYMYKEQQNWSYFTKKIKYDENNRIQKDLKITHYQFQSSFSFLEDLELIEYKEKYWRISKSGLEIILNLRKHQDNNKFQEIQIKTNKVIIFLTFILSLSAISQTSIFLFSEEFTTKRLFGFLILLLSITYGIIELIKSKNN